MLSHLEVRVDQRATAMVGPACQFIEVGQIMWRDPGGAEDVPARQGGYPRFSRLRMPGNPRDECAHKDKQKRVDRQEVTVPDVPTTRRYGDKVDQRRSCHK